MFSELPPRLLGQTSVISAKTREPRYMGFIATRCCFFCGEPERGMAFQCYFSLQNAHDVESKGWLRFLA